VSNDIPEIDEETNEWPVPSEFQEELDDIKETYQATPLKVYIGNKFVEPLDVCAALSNALVEMHFTIQHYRIAKESAFDSFSAVIQQILVLKPGVSKNASPYKRKNFRDGPVKVKAPKISGQSSNMLGTTPTRAPSTPAKATMTPGLSDGIILMLFDGCKPCHRDFARDCQTTFQYPDGVRNSTFGTC
jgi:hypothetical protein